MFLYVNFPSWIHASIFPGVPFLELFRWYGLMYIVAVSTAFLVLKQICKEGQLDSKNYKCKEDDLISYIGTGFLFLLIGARIFSVLIYQESDYYWKKPWMIFWPFDERGNFTGLAGMSYHGGVVGGFAGCIIWCFKNKKPFFKWGDAICCSIPLGYTFGRLGNFMNGELYGRITTMPWGMVFPNAERFRISQPWVRDFIDKIGMKVAENASVVNLPRHPSQLYEAFFEGIVLWLILWTVRKHKKWDGIITGLYTSGYGFIRFFIEYFRQPDSDIGYRIAKNASADIYTNSSLLNISTGQILCFIMILSGIGIIIGSYFWDKRNKKNP